MANERGGLDGAASIDWSFAAAAPQPYLPPRSPIYNAGIHDSNNNSFFSNYWPKLPNPASDANSIPNRRHHQRTPSTSFLSTQAPAWVNDLLDDTPADVSAPAVKYSHRRSSSDSLAFMEAPSQQALFLQTGEEGPTNNIGNISIRSADANDWTASEAARTGGALHLQKQNMVFPKVAFHSSSSTRERMIRMQETSSAAPSDHDSANASSMDDEKSKGLNVQVKNESGEVESVLKSETTIAMAATAAATIATTTTGKGEVSPNVEAPLDPKRAKRILANRQSAQRSRVRKLQYISELEKTVNILQEEVSVLSPQVTYLDRHRIILNVDNSAMKQRLAALAQEKLFKDAHNEALKNEVHRLRQLYQHQQQKKHQQQQNLSCNMNQQHLGSLPLSPQQEMKESEAGLDATRCTDYVVDENKVDLINDSVPPPRSPLMKPIGPSSCSTGDKTKVMHTQVMPGVSHLHPDVRVQNP